MSLMMTAMRVPNETDIIEKFHHIIVSEFSVCVCVKKVDVHLKVYVGELRLLRELQISTHPNRAL